MKTRNIFFPALSVIILILMACASRSTVPVSVCTYEGASKRGIADAQGGQGMQAMQVAESCDPAVRSTVEKWYRDAFNAYDGVEPSALKSETAKSNDPSKCKHKAECSEHKWCRNRGDGVWTCLGNEARDGYCEFEDDCGFGLLCRKGKDKIGRCE